MYIFIYCSCHPQLAYAFAGTPYSSCHLQQTHIYILIHILMYCSCHPQMAYTFAGTQYSA